MKTKKKIIAAFLAVVLCMHLCNMQVCAGGAQPNKYNVVFVIDGSGSMKQTDPEGWRYEAIDLFLALLTDEGNNVGSIVFNEEIMEKQDITAVKGVGSKKVISQKLVDAGASGDTDIGKAIEAAAEMLEQQGDPALPSVIILLSDGYTDLPKAELQKSYASRDNAIQSCTQNGYPIYSICLNEDNSAKPEELREISEATGGEFIEITNAKDLKGVLTQFYNFIYASSTTTIFDDAIPEDGILEIPFTIPAVGVEEVNIIVTNSDKLQNLTLIQPSGSAYSQSELDKLKMEGDTFTLLKIANPQEGMWMLNAKGIPGDHVKIDMIYNSDFSVESTYSPEKSSYSKGEQISVKAELKNGSAAVTDPSVYQIYEAVLTVTNMADNTIEEIPMSSAGLGYAADYTLDEKGTFSARVKVSIEGNYGYGPEMKFMVENSAPVVLNTPIEVVVKRSLLKQSGTIEYELEGTAQDPEGSEIRYAIAASDYDADVAAMDGTQVKIDRKKVTDGSLTLTATDSEGSSTEFEMQIKVKDSGKLAMGILGGVLFVALLVLLIFLLRKKNIRYNGEITVQAFDNENGENGVPETDSPLKGKIGLYQFTDQGYGVDVGKCYFMPSGKDYIYFVSKKGYYSNVFADKKVKKIRIDANYEIVISSSDDLSTGIKVIFAPFQNEY